MASTRAAGNPDLAMDNAYEHCLIPTFGSDFGVESRGIAITAAGALRLIMVGGEDVTIPTGMAVGVIHRIRATQVVSSGTTVTAGNVIVFH